MAERKKEKKKKIKNIALEQTELTPTTIGIFENRKKNSIGVFVLLTLFVLIVFFLPEISNLVNKYLNPDATIIPSGPNNPVEPIKPPEEGENKNNEFYELNETLSISREDITLSDFVVDKENNTLAYSLTNSSNNYQDMEALNYYLEIYNENRTLLERVKVASMTSLASGAFRNVIKNISATSADTIFYLTLVKKTTMDYPQFNLSNITVDGIGTLVCTRDNEKVTYKFRSGELSELTNEISYLSDATNYAETLAANKLLVNNYNNSTGIVSNLIENASGHNIMTNVDLERSARTYIFNADTFTKGTEPKVVKFEMEAQNFICE